MLSASDPRISVVINTAPSADLEPAELILALAAFDLPVQVFFTGNGLFWLLPQEARKPNGKAPLKVLSAFPLYGVETLFYCRDDQSALGLETATLPEYSTPLFAAEIGRQLQHSTQVFTF